MTHCLNCGAERTAESERAGAKRARGRSLRNGDVGVLAVERVEHLTLRVLDAARQRRHGDDEPDAEGETQGDDAGLPGSPAQLAC